MPSEEQKSFARDVLAKMRLAFEAQDWDQTVLAYRQFTEVQGDRASRVEATCMAARALAAAKDRSAARALLKPLKIEGYKKPVHYEFLARAYLDIKQYKKAAEACERAEELRLLEAKES